MEKPPDKSPRLEWTSARKTTESAKKVRTLVKQMYVEGQQALADGKPVAWVMLTTNNFIYKAMDIVPIMPESYGGLCATKRVGGPYIEKAEAGGYANVLCGYSRTHLGYCMSVCEVGDIPPDAPEGGLARPTVIIGNSQSCDAHVKWAEAIRRYFDVPSFSYDVIWPWSDVAQRPDVREQYIKYNVDQNLRLIRFLEEHTGHRMDWDKLNRVVDLYHAEQQAFAQTRELRQAIPCSLPSEDIFNIFVPHLMLPGEERTLKFYQELVEELKHRVQNKMGVIPEEKYRLIWGPGLVPWHSMKLFNDFEKRGAVFVWEIAYETPELLPDIPDNITDPLERWAWGQYESLLQRHRRSVVGGYNFMAGFMTENPLEYIEPFQADGVVFHWLKSCRGTTIGQIWMQRLIQVHSDLPVLHLESDTCDVRDMVESEWSAKIEAFIEVVDARKQRKR